MVAKFHRAGLKDARLRAGLTQAELARKIGITRHFVLEVENGHRDAGYATMSKWVRALGADGSFDLFRQLSRKPEGKSIRRWGPPRATKADAAEVA
jgi:transcriptional regulator with XRE-family HTH domain